MNVSKGLMGGVLLLLSMVIGVSAENLYVYYPSTMKSNVVQQKMQSASSDVTVTVFGKYRDFQMKAAMDSPDAVLAKKEGIVDLAGYTVSVNAHRNGSKNEKYVLLSVDNAIDPVSITPQTVIGVVDFNRRNVMNDFVASLLGKLPKVKHVTKVEDLLPLLTFQMAQGVVVPESDVEFFKKKSNLNFVATPLSGTSSVAVVATKGGGANAVKVAQELTKLMPGFMGSVEWKN